MWVCVPDKLIRIIWFSVFHSDVWAWEHKGKYKLKMMFIVFVKEVQSHNGQPCPYHHHPNMRSRKVGTLVKKQFTSFIHLFDNHFCTQYVSSIKKEKTDLTGEN